MTVSELHNIVDFGKLFDDERLKAALVYLRAHFPNAEKADGSEWRGYYRALEELEKLRFPVFSKAAQTEKPAPYTTVRAPESKK